MKAVPSDQLIPGTWVLISKDGVAHLAVSVEGGLPSGKARCGAAGTAVILTSTQKISPCHVCLQLGSAVGTA